VSRLRVIAGVIALACALAVLTFTAGAHVGQASVPHHPPACIVVDPNGAPAPAACNDPGAYEIFPGD